MESGERKKNGDNKAGTARIGWGGIRKTDLEITGQEDAASWEDGALGRIGTRLQGQRDHCGDDELWSESQGGRENTVYHNREDTWGGRGSRVRENPWEGESPDLGTHPTY